MRIDSSGMDRNRWDPFLGFFADLAPCFIFRLNVTMKAETHQYYEKFGEILSILFEHSVDVHSLDSLELAI